MFSRPHRYIRVLAASTVACSAAMLSLGIGVAEANDAECRAERARIITAIKLHNKWTPPCSGEVHVLCDAYNQEYVQLVQQILAHNARCPSHSIMPPGKTRTRPQKPTPRPQKPTPRTPHKPKGGHGVTTGQNRTYHDAVKVAEQMAPKIDSTSPRRTTRVVGSEQELNRIAYKLTQGITPEDRPVPGKGIAKVYFLPDGGNVTVRNFSNSGGKTIDINPPEGVKNEKQTRIHIKG